MADIKSWEAMYHFMKDFKKDSYKSYEDINNAFFVGQRYVEDMKNQFTDFKPVETGVMSMKITECVAFKLYAIDTSYYKKRHNDIKDAARILSFYDRAELACAASYITSGKKNMQPKAKEIAKNVLNELDMLFGKKKRKKSVLDLS